MNLLREYIRELIKEEGPLGKWVWPTAMGGDTPDEQDTDVEEMLYQQLHNHFGAISPMSDEAISAVQQILGSGQYSSIFRRCSSGQILRGLRLPVSWLEQYAPEALEALSTERKDPLDWGPPVPIASMTYKSEGKFGKISSWTGNWREARRFTTMWSPDSIPVILHSDCNSGYFMETRPFGDFVGGRYKDEFGIKKLNPNAHEGEIILFGDCQVTAVEINATKQDIEKIKK